MGFTSRTRLWMSKFRGLFPFPRALHPLVQRWNAHDCRHYAATAHVPLSIGDQAAERMPKLHLRVGLERMVFMHFGRKL